MSKKNRETAIYSEMTAYSNNELYNSGKSVPEQSPVYRTSDLFTMDDAAEGASKPLYSSGPQEFKSGTVGFQEGMDFCIDTIEKGGRPLTTDEESLLRTVFGDQLDYSVIRVHKGSWLFTIGGSSRTVKNNIYLHRDHIGDKSILVHESAHVWQYQGAWGSAYIINALNSHATDGFIALIDHVPANLLYLHYDPYDYSCNITDNVPWDKWSAEQQAKYIQDMWCAFDKGCKLNTDFDKFEEDMNCKLGEDY